MKKAARKTVQFQSDVKFLCDDCIAQYIIEEKIVPCFLTGYFPPSIPFTDMKKECDGCGNVPKIVSSIMVSGIKKEEE